MALVPLSAAGLESLRSSGVVPTRTALSPSILHRLGRDVTTGQRTVVPATARATDPFGTAVGALGGATGLARETNSLFGGPSDVGQTLADVGTGAQVIGGALDLARGRSTGAMKLAAAVPSIAQRVFPGTFGASIARAATPILGAASGAYSLAKGDVPSGVTGLTQAGGSLATLLGEAGAGAGLSAIGGMAGAGVVLGQLLQFLDRIPGKGYSKALMQRKQDSLTTGAVQGVDARIKGAPDFASALGVLARVPPGSGQLQYGVGTDYAGETQIGTSSLTTTPGWARAVQAGASDPLNFVKNFWVQAGPGGATTFNAGLTRQWRLELAKKLPDSAEKQQLVAELSNPDAPDPVDPRDSQARPDPNATPNHRQLEAQLKQAMDNETYQSMLLTSDPHRMSADTLKHMIQSASPPPQTITPVGQDTPMTGPAFSAASGGYVDAPEGTPVPATVHGGEYVVPAGPQAERLRQESRWFVSPTRGLYQSPVALDPNNDWSVITLGSDEEDDPSPPTVERLRAAGERPIVVPQDLYDQLAPGEDEPYVERLRWDQYEAPAVRRQWNTGARPGGIGGIGGPLDPSGTLVTPPPQVPRSLAPSRPGLVPIPTDKAAALRRRLSLAA